MTKKCNSKQLGFDLMLSCFTYVAFFFLSGNMYLFKQCCMPCLYFHRDYCMGLCKLESFLIFCC